MCGIIYKITNKINGKSYIGQTVRGLKARWQRHRSDCFNKKSKLAIHEAIRKYGVENFEIKELAQCISLEEMNHMEMYYIKLFNSLSPNGYNLTDGGKNWIPTKETRNKISKAMKGRPAHNKGKKQSKEQVERRCSSIRGKKLSAEHKLKLSKVHGKPIICHENDKIYSSTKDAGLELKIFPSNIFKVLQGTRKQVGGYTFSYYRGKIKL